MENNRHLYHTRFLGGFIFLILLIAIIGCKPNGNQKSEPGKRDKSIRLLTEEYYRASKSNFDSSRIALKSLLRALDSLKKFKPDSSLGVMSQVAAKEVVSGNFSLADSLSDYTVSHINEFRDSSVIARVLNNKGRVMEEEGKSDSAFYYYGKALHIAKLCHDSIASLPPMINLANAMVQRQNSSEGINYLKEALEIAKKTKAKQYIADLYTSIGRAYELRGSYLLAFQYYKSAIDTLGKINLKQNYLEPLNNLANIYLNFGNDSLALQYYQKVNHLSAELKNVKMRAIALINIGNLYFQNGKNSLALKNTNEAMHLLGNRNEPYLYSIIYLNLGLIYRNLTEPELSFQNLNKSVSIARKNGIYEVLAEGNMELAKYYVKKHNYARAKEVGQIAYRYAHTNHMLDVLPGTSLILAKIYRATGEGSKALKYYNLYSTYNSQYQDTLNNKQTRNYTFLYELQKKETANKILKQRQQLDKQVLANVRLKLSQQRIVIIFSVITILSALFILFLLYYRSRLKSSLNKALLRNNEEISIQNKLLEKENVFKSKLISIVSHDIRSPILSFHQILELLISTELSEDEKLELVKDNMQLTDRTLNMVDDLLSWTRQQLNTSTVHFSSVNVNGLSNEIISYFYSDAAEKNIKLHNSCPQDIEVYSDYQMLKMVVRNLFSNALKFTQHGGTIEMGANVTDGHVILHVSDTGIGIKKEDQSKIFDEEKYFTTIGIRGEHGNGLGLKLCRNFIENSGGKIWLESRQNEGTTFFVEIKRRQNADK